MLRLVSLAVFGCFWAFLTGSFFALPGLSPGVGWCGLVIAVGYSSVICLWGHSSVIGLAIGLTTLLTVAYVLVTRTDFSVINYAVWMAANLNFVVFGSLALTLQTTLPVWQTWLITAGTFGGSLGCGWVVALWMT